MHPCLQVTELIRLIFDYIEPAANGLYATPGHDSESLKTLSSLARTCKSFTEPSVDRLWRDQYSLAPLVQCMPQDLWVVSQVPNQSPNQKRVRFRRPIQRTDWDRFEYYARKIRRLGFSTRWSPGWCWNKASINVSKKMLLDLNSSRRHQYLLPSLISLQIFYHAETRVFVEPCAQGILGPTITEIKIYADAPGDFSDFKLFCSALSLLAPNIQRVSYSMDRTWNDAEDAFLLLSNLPNLQSFTLEFPHLGLLTDSISLLASHTKLTSFCGVKISPGNLHLFTTRNGQFPNLKKFGFSAGWSAGNTLLESMRCRFESLEIYIQDQVYDPRGLEQLTAAFTRHPSRLVLKHIRLRWDVEGERNTGIPSASRLLEPLLLCTTLESVEIYSPSHTGFNDQWLGKAARAWKSLRRLNLSERDCPPQITLAGLIPLVRHCPHLYFLALELQAIPVDSTLLEHVKNHNITSLTLGNSVITRNSAFQFTRSLVSMFPNLREIGLGYGDKQRPAWEQVNRWLRNRDCL